MVGLTLELEDPLLFEVEKGLRGVLEDAGVVVIGLPRDTPVADIDAVLDLVDGLTLSGGADVDPAYYDEERHHTTAPIHARHDAFELGLARRALESGVPVLGVCRGSQVLAVADGGSLTQDVETLHAGAHRHRHPWQDSALVPPGEHWHQVRCAPGSRIERWLANGPPRVNSYHHQAVARTGRVLRPTAWSLDGAIEAIEASDGAPFAVGLQWHNELMWRHDARFRSPHRELADAAFGFRHARSGVAERLGRQHAGQ